MEKTTIQLNQSTLERLKTIKKYGRQSYDELLNDLVDDVQEERLSAEEIEDIKLALEEIKQGKVYPIEAVARELGIALK